MMENNDDISSLMANLDVSRQVYGLSTIATDEEMPAEHREQAKAMLGELYETLVQDENHEETLPKLKMFREGVVPHEIREKAKQLVSLRDQEQRLGHTYNLKLSDDEVTDLINQVGSGDDDEVIQHMLVLDRNKVQNPLLRTFASDHPNLQAVFDLILKMEPLRRGIMLARLAGYLKSKKISNEFYDKSIAEVEGLANAWVEQGDDDAYDALTEVYGASGSLPFARKMGMAWQEMTSARSKPKPTLESKPTLQVGDLDELSIDDDWTTCEFSLENGTDRIMTLMLMLTDDTSRQRVIISPKNATANGVRGKLVAAGFKHSGRRTQREWEYETYER
ncbi:MAG: hypothetical protein RLP44_20285 [Aggregatilineales bacterium]